MSTPPVLEATRITKSFGSGPTRVVAVDRVSLAVRAGEIVLVMGPSGSGKTTLLSMIGGLLRPTNGSIRIGRSEITALPEREVARVRATHVGFIFQGFNLLDALTVEENVLLPAQLTAGGIDEARPRARDLLERLEIIGRRDAFPPTLSGGEKQRVAIARALMNRPPLLLADEPTGNLDSEKGKEVTMILHDAARDEGCSVVIVTHDPRIEEVADRVLWLEDGRLGERASRQVSWTRDPVCGMLVEAGNTGFVEEHGSVRFAFCSRGCLNRFRQDPEAYVAPLSSVDSNTSPSR